MPARTVRRLAALGLTALAAAGCGRSEKDVTAAQLGPESYIHLS